MAQQIPYSTVFYFLLTQLKVYINDILHHVRAMRVCHEHTARAKLSSCKPFCMCKRMSPDIDCDLVDKCFDCLSFSPRQVLITLLAS